MSKIILFWLIGLLTVSFVIGGGHWLFFSVFDKAKKRKIL